MKKSLEQNMNKLLEQRKALDVKIARIKEELKTERRSAILRMIEASGLADLQDAELRKVLDSMRMAGASV